MATRRRSSATKTAKSASPKTVKETVVSVKKVTAKPARRVNKVTRTAKSAVTEVTTTPEIKETKVSTKSLIEKLRELDGFSLAILPFLYLEGFAKLLLKNQFLKSKSNHFKKVISHNNFKIWFKGTTRTSENLEKIWRNLSLL